MAWRRHRRPLGEDAVARDANSATSRPAGFTPSSGPKVSRPVRDPKLGEIAGGEGELPQSSLHEAAIRLQCNELLVRGVVRRVIQRGCGRCKSHRAVLRDEKVLVPPIGFMGSV